MKIIISQLLHQGTGPFGAVHKTIHNIQKLLELRSQNDKEIHVEEVRKRGNQIKMGDKKYYLSDLDTHKNELKDG